MERLPEEEYAGKNVRGVRERPRCDRCGRVVRISPDDYERDEVLCPSCAADARAAKIPDPEFDGRI